MQLMADRYPGLTVWEFDTSQFIEDNIGHYISVLPIPNDRNGMSSVKTKDGILSVKHSYYIIWRLPRLDENILKDVLKETYQTGDIISVTTDIEYFTKKVYPDADYVPGGERTFVAVQVDINFDIVITKTPCECLLSCFL